MFSFNARAVLTAGILAFATLSAARAEEAQSHCGDGCAQPCVQYKEICVTECVPEYYTTYKTCYKTEKVCETYTAYKCIQVPEKKTRTITCYKKVPVWKCVKKPYCVSVPCTKTITVMEKSWVCKPVTTYKKKWEDRGHWSTNVSKSNQVSLSDLAESSRRRIAANVILVLSMRPKKSGVQTRSV